MTEKERLERKRELTKEIYQLGDADMPLDLGKAKAKARLAALKQRLAEMG